MKRYLTEDIARQIVHEILAEAKRYLDGRRPVNWIGQVHRVKQALAEQALIFQVRARNLVDFADQLTTDQTFADWERLAKETEVADYDDHYIRVLQDVENFGTSMREEPGHGWWPPQTPEQYGYQAGFSAEPRHCPYTVWNHPDSATQADVDAWLAGYDAGRAKYCEIELDVGNCPVCRHAAHEGAVCETVIEPEGESCGCDRTPDSAESADVPDALGPVWTIPVGQGHPFPERGKETPGKVGP